jgi:FlaA1/EpsC-like NDP-sugar epimerase
MGDDRPTRRSAPGQAWPGGRLGRGVKTSGARPPGLPDRIVRRLRRDVPLACLDGAAVVTAYLGPLVVRYDGAIPDPSWAGFRTFVPVAVLIHLACNHLWSLYGQMWRYASVQEARRVLLAGATAGAATVAAALALSAGRGGAILPPSVLVAGPILSILGHGTIRFQSRLFAFHRRTVGAAGARVLIVGAGEAGAILIRDIARNPAVGLEPVGLVDDDPRKHGLSIHGVPVLGGRAAIPPFVAKHRVDQVLLAIPSATSETVQEIAALCGEADVPLRVLPSTREIVGGRLGVRDLRDLSIEDLLGRQQVRTDAEAMTAILRGKRVLVTGAGGSIGSEIARQVAHMGPARLVMLDHDETHLHDALLEVDDVAEPVLADVRDADRLLQVFAEHRPEVVFHAAAHKHVPLLETHPEEALLTNVIGTANVADAALAAGCGRLVLISTDKAINPSSVMGASKWLAEQIVRSLHGNGTILCAVRFGNVLGSRGSVIPTFLRQIARGGPVTVTDPSMTRYFMSVQEAVQLVLQAAALSEGGEVFTLDMGEPVNIYDLARKVVRLAGRVPGRDVEIRIVGPRRGEKLAEELVDPEEERLPTSHPAIVVSRPPPPDRAALRQAIRELESLARQGAAGELAERMKALTASGMRVARAREAG